MIKIQSLTSIYERAKNSFVKFPLTILSSMLAAFVAMYLLETEPRQPDFTLINLMLCGALGIPLFFSVGIYAERKQLALKQRLLLSLGGLVVLILIYFSFPGDNTVSNIAIPYIRYVIFNVIIHLLVSFVPYFSKGNFNGFWQYNKGLFLRFLEAVLYSGFLYAGLAIALGTLHLLFDLDISEKLYFHLFIFIVGVFNTWFFVSGVPLDFEKLEQNENYPKGLKIFTQYILLPLLTIYIIILYSYGLKIIISSNWPEGIVSYLIICVAVVGIFLLLLLYPYQKAASNNWVKKFSLIYYIALVPLVIMLFMAIGIRIGDYGVTINRYLIVLLGIWLSIVCGYFLVGQKNIKFIPMSLSAILLLTSYGPWSIFSISESSQMGRLEKIFEQNNLVEEGKIRNQLEWELGESNEMIMDGESQINESLLSDSLHNEVKSILDYLDDFHDLNEVKGFMNQRNLDSMILAARDSNQYVNRAKVYMEAMGLGYYSKTSYSSVYFSYSRRHDAVKRVTGYDYLVPFSATSFSTPGRKADFTLDSVSYQTVLDEKVLLIFNDNDSVRVDLNPVIDRLMKKYGKRNASKISRKEMMIEQSSASFDLRLDIQYMNLDQANNDLVLSSINGDLLISRK